MVERSEEEATGLGERLLAGGFQGLCWVMRAAAQCCGLGAQEEPSQRASRAVDFQALALLGYVPLAEIAIAERELRTPADSAARSSAPLTAERVSGVASVAYRSRRVPVEPRRARPRRSARLSHGRA